MNHPWLRLQYVMFLLVYVLMGTAQAQTPSSAAAIGNAGAGRASIEPQDIHDLNPANLTLLRGTEIHSGITQDGWNVGVTDNSRGNLFAGAIAYEETNLLSANGKSKTRMDDIRASFAERFLEHFSFGVTPHQQTFVTDQSSANVFHQTNADLGITWLASSHLGFALVEYDVLSPNSEIPQTLQTTSRTGVGVTYAYKESLRLKGDIVSSANNSFAPCSVLLGYEAAVNQFLVFRLGYGTEPEFSRESVAGGFGFELPRFRINYGYQSTVHGDGENRHTVDLAIPF